MIVPSKYTFLSDFATESDLKDLKNELEIMASVGYHPNLVNLIGACSSEGESVLKSQKYFSRDHLLARIIIVGQPFNCLVSGKG